MPTQHNRSKNDHDPSHSFEPVDCLFEGYVKSAHSHPNLSYFGTIVDSHRFIPPS
jgi:hypothetical protein